MTDESESGEELRIGVLSDGENLALQLVEDAKNFRRRVAAMLLSRGSYSHCGALAIDRVLETSDGGVTISGRFVESDQRYKSIPPKERAFSKSFSAMTYQRAHSDLKSQENSNDKELFRRAPRSGD